MVKLVKIEWDVVEVAWLDAQSTQDIVTIEYIKKELKPVFSKSVGYLVHETKEYIVLCNTCFGNGLLFKDYHVIPRCTIKKMENLNRKKTEVE